MALEVDARSFATLAEARAHALVGEDDPERVAALCSCLNAAAAVMEQYCGRVLKLRAIDELVDGDGTDRAFCQEWPLATDPVPVIYADPDGEWSTSTMLSVWPGTGAWGSYDVVPDYSTGELTFRTGCWPASRKAIRIVGEAGYEASLDLKRAQLEIAHAMLEAVGRDPALTSETVLGMSRAFIGGRTQAEAEFVGMPPVAKRTLDAYRRPACLS